MNYIAFILGYDLLHDMFVKSSKPETDIVFEFCNIIAEEFLKSDEYGDMRYSAYDALQLWVDKNIDDIKQRYNKFH